MRFLLDTHVLLWAAYEPQKISVASTQLLSDPKTTLVYSSASIWEICIKKALGREDFNIDVSALLRGLRLNGYLELPISSAHAITQSYLPTLHKDPFDRILIAQAMEEKITLLTADSAVLKYEGPIQEL